MHDSATWGGRSQAAVRDSCVGAVLKAFLARQVPTNGRRKAVAKTDSSGWRPAVKNPHTPNGSMWHGFVNCELQTAVCEQPINLSGPSGHLSYEARLWCPTLP